MLTETELRSYRENGYLVVENTLDDAVLHRLRAAVTELRTQALSVTESNRVFDVLPGHSAHTPRLRRVVAPVRNHPDFDRLMRSNRIVDLATSLLDGTARFDHSKLNFKPPGRGTAIHWHQDWAFNPRTNDDMLTIGVMIEDCTPDNGPLMVIPGSHLGPVHDHHRDGIFVGGVAPEAMGALLDQAVELTAPAGSVTVHHTRTLHASRENRSDSDRPLLLLTYSAVDAFPVFDARDLEDYDTSIVRGKATLAPRMSEVQVRLPWPRRAGRTSIFDDQVGLAEAD